MKVRIKKKHKDKFKELRRLSLEQVIKDQQSYLKDLMYFYNMTQEDADIYYRELRYNEDLVKNKLNSK
jgi:hypothetical protein